MGHSPGLSSDRIPWVWILAAAAALLYIPFIGGVALFDWDEINFAEISREMITTGDYLNIQVNYKPFFEKPPFFPWLQVLCMKAFGINEFAARLPNAVAGILVVIFLFKTGSRWIDRRFGLFWALSYMGSILPALYHKSGIIDPWFNLFIFSGIVAWVEGSRATGSKSKWYFISGLLSGMAVLTKGPVGPLLIGLTVLIMRIWSKDKTFLQAKSVLLFILGNSLIAGLWFGANWISNGPDFIMAFLKYQAQLLTESVAGHKGFPGYHFVVTLFGVFPASLFAIGAMHKKTEDEPVDAYRLRLLMMIITGVVLVLFSVVQSKIVHYSSLAYYPVSFLSAWTICRLLDRKYSWNAWHLAVCMLVCTVVVAAMILLPLVGQQMEWLRTSFTFDAFTAATLAADVQWGMIDYTPAIWILIVFGISAFLWRKSNREYSMLTLFAGTGVFVSVALIFFIGKIERYSQHAAIEFSEKYEGQQVEIKTIGFKSYLPFFYAKKPVPDPTRSSEELPQYYILKTDKRKKLADRPELKIMYEKNGFIFLEEK
jgi:4-amino-4-deoxy-L-arabinose transferase-like glycosyltransferase